MNRRNFLKVIPLALVGLLVKPTPKSNAGKWRHVLAWHDSKSQYFEARKKLSEAAWVSQWSLQENGNDSVGTNHLTTTGTMADGTWKIEGWV